MDNYVGREESSLSKVSSFENYYNSKEDENLRLAYSPDAIHLPSKPNSMSTC